jgi:hypothetical protein
VEQYLDFIRETCIGVFYSRNQDRQPRNQELASLNSMMQRRFSMTEVPEWRPRGTNRRTMKNILRFVARSLAGRLGLIESAGRGKEHENPYRQFICVARR